ncbi:hypothetical protein E4634_10765 [Mangrovimicrobium sediminis]|uniref:Sulfotransferase domain-containing protein n=1 Tax=Mangrovimicrobium sediminis TaxID=2562682 RepID=A0A4Z0M237_9GAMM|nr:hypothetical protein [Haliea sp. SAOS-164]TGD73504.1 hypothetical protein E4634_10765 [Haliea sp. SAOS-164]
MKRLVLHTGMPKTATSTLQEAVFRQHPDVFYLGKSTKNGVTKGTRSQEIYDVLKPVLWSPKGNTDYAALAARFKELAIDPAGEEQVVIASWEGLGGIRERRFRSLLERVQQIYPEYRLLKCLRNPVNWVTSQYLQNVQGQFLKKNRDAYFHGRPWVPFETWLKRRYTKHGDMSLWLSAADNIKVAVDVLGRENVGVFLFEDMIADADAYYRGISEFIGIDGEKTLELVAGAHANPRLTQAEYDHIREVDSSLVARTRWRFSPDAERRRQMRKISRAQPDSPGVKIALTDEVRQRVIDSTCEGNRWLRDELGLDVERHGYPL